MSAHFHVVSFRLNRTSPAEHFSPFFAARFSKLFILIFKFWSNLEKILTYYHFLTEFFVGSSNWTLIAHELVSGYWVEDWYIVSDQISMRLRPIKGYCSLNKIFSILTRFEPETLPWGEQVPNNLNQLMLVCAVDMLTSTPSRCYFSSCFPLNS